MAASVLIAPANTASPGPRVLGTLSPVTGLSSTPEVPSTISPSAGMRSPGRTRTVWPMARLAAGTSRVVPFTSRSAVLGTSLARARMPSRALPAATPSSTSPTAKRNTTSAASSAASMNSAPTAAIVIRLSMVKGWPIRSAAKARRATGATPMRQAATKAHRPMSGAINSTIQAAPSRTAVKMTSLPFPVWYQCLPRSAGSSWTWPGLPWPESSRGESFPCVAWS